MKIKSQILSLLSMAMGYIMGDITKPKKPVRADGLYGAPPTSPKKVVPRGHQKFLIQGEEVWALNYKNAVKKYSKLFTEDAGN